MIERKVEMSWSSGDAKKVAGDSTMKGRMRTVEGSMYCDMRGGGTADGI